MQFCVETRLFHKEKRQIAMEKELSEGEIKEIHKDEAANQRETRLCSMEIQAKFVEKEDACG